MVILHHVTCSGITCRLQAQARGEAEAAAAGVSVYGIRHSCVLGACAPEELAALTSQARSLPARLPASSCCLILPLLQDSLTPCGFDTRNHVQPPCNADHGPAAADRSCVLS